MRAGGSGLLFGQPPPREVPVTCSFLPVLCRLSFTGGSRAWIYRQLVLNKETGTSIINSGLQGACELKSPPPLPPNPSPIPPPLNLPPEWKSSLRRCFQIWQGLWFCRALQTHMRKPWLWHKVGIINDSRNEARPDVQAHNNSNALHFYSAVSTQIHIHYQTQKEGDLIREKEMVQWHGERGWLGGRAMDSQLKGLGSSPIRSSRRILFSADSYFSIRSTPVLPQ